MPIHMVAGSGRVVVDAATRAAMTPSTLTVGVSPVDFDGNPGPTKSGVLQDDLSFSFKAWPASCRIRVLPEALWTIKSVKLNGVDVTGKPIDFVEGGQDATYDATGGLTWSGGGDRLAFDFSASDQPRFLVVNELWDRGWSAYVDQQQVPVLPTNVAMRGVLVPPGATHLEMDYRSLLWWAWWYTPAVAALLAIGLFVLQKRFRVGQPR
jgi:hypothetical protein